MSEPEVDAQAIVPRKKKMVKRKPARKQVEVGQVVKKQPEQTGQTFNVWYGKWAGGDKYDDYNAKEKSQTRVSIKNDAGYTRADAGSSAYLCLFFARGCCPYGQDCSFLHRLPPKAHVLPDASMDVFGRDKHSDYRDDMGGVGSFTRQNRTLYIGRITETRNTAEVVEKHFEEFGEIERIKILQSRGVAFVTYVQELNAQFAKEAMMHQSLDSDEILNVRWATEDPNPAAIRAEQRRLHKLGQDGVAASLDPVFIENVRQLDELEGRIAPRELEAPPPLAQIQGGEAEEEEEDDGRATKRARIEAPVEAPVAAAVPVEEVKGGLLGASTLSNLRVLAEMGRGVAGVGAGPIKAAAPPPPAAKVGGLGGLADYGSDSEED